MRYVVAVFILIVTLTTFHACVRGPVDTPQVLRSYYDVQTDTSYDISAWEKKLEKELEKQDEQENPCNVTMYPDKKHQQ